MINKWVLLLSFICPLCTANVLAQSPDWNLDFEVWDSTDVTPDLWYDTTVVENRVGLFPPQWHYRPDHIQEGRGLAQTTDATHGDYAVAMSGFYSYEVMRIISGNSAEKPGWPINYTPDKLTGTYKAILLGTLCDSLRAYVDVYLTKYDSLLGSRDTIGSGSLILNETSNTYTTFEVDITYVSSTPSPDSVTIVLAKQRFGFESPPGCLECSHVFFDNLALTTLTSTAERMPSPHEVKVFPNPTQQHFVIDAGCDACLFSLTLTNASGQTLRHYEQVSSGFSVDTRGLTQGVYFLKVGEVGSGLFSYRKILVR